MKNIVLNNLAAFLQGIDGIWGCKSELGIPYLTIAFQTPGRFGEHAPLIKLEAALVQQLMKARAQGAMQIVWRSRPEITYDRDGTNVDVFARLHFIPDIRDGLVIKPEGEPIPEIPK